MTSQVYSLQATSPFYPLLIFQMDLWRCLSSSSSHPRGNWFSAVTVSRCSAPHPTSTSRWSCGGVTTATSWARRRTGASTWRKPCCTTAASWPGTRRGERREGDGDGGDVSWELISCWLACCTDTHTHGPSRLIKSKHTSVHIKTVENLHVHWHTNAPLPHLSLTHRSCDLPFVIGALDKDLKGQDRIGLAACQHLIAICGAFLGVGRPADPSTLVDR